MIDYDGVDSFFYFLLNLGQLRNRTALPNDIGYCMNHGLSTYNAVSYTHLDVYKRQARTYAVIGSFSMACTVGFLMNLLKFASLEKMELS